MSFKPNLKPMKINISLPPIIKRASKNTATDSPYSPVTPIEECIEAIDSEDFVSIKEIGMKHGFGDATNNNARLKAWNALLGVGVNTPFSLDIISEENAFDSMDIFNNDYARIIGKDLKRNGYSHWDITSNYSELQKEYDLSQIEKLLNSVFAEYAEFNYIQSFDSVFSVFYLIANGNLFCAKQMIISYLHIFKSDLSLNEVSFGQLKTMWPLLKKYDSSYYKWLTRIVGSTEDVSFALEWYIAWCSHSSIASFDLILRLFDFMIASQNEQVGVYMALSILLCNKKEIMQNVDCFGELMLFTKNEIKFDENIIDDMIDKCFEIIIIESKRSQRRKSWKRNKNEIGRKWNVVKRKLHKKNVHKVSVAVVDDAMIKKAVNVIKRAEQRQMERVEVEQFLRDKGLSAYEIERAYEVYNQ